MPDPGICFALWLDLPRDLCDEILRQVTFLRVRATSQDLSMTLHRHEGIAECGLSSALLACVEQPDRVRQLRQVLGGFTHRCRNSLHGIKMSLYLCRRGIEGPEPQSWVELEQTYKQAERLLDRLQEIYRPMQASMVRSSLGQLFAERLPVWRSWFSGRAKVLKVKAPVDEGHGDYDPMRLRSGLDAFIASRLVDGPRGGDVHLAWRTHQGFFEIMWNEDDSRAPGPVEPKASPSAGWSAESPSCDSLAIPLLARIAMAHGGHINVNWNPAFCLTVRWPQYQTLSRLDSDGRSCLTSNEATDRGA